MSHGGGLAKLSGIARQLRPARIDQICLFGAIQELAARHAGPAPTAAVAAGDVSLNRVCSNCAPSSNPRWCAAEPDLSDGIVIGRPALLRQVPDEVSSQIAVTQSLPNRGIASAARAVLMDWRSEWMHHTQLHRYDRRVLVIRPGWSPYWANPDMHDESECSTFLDRGESDTDPRDMCCCRREVSTRTPCSSGGHAGCQ